MKLFVIIAIIAIIGYLLLFKKAHCEGFYNIVPTELIDPQYQNINNGFDGINDADGVDLNCNNVRAQDIVMCLGKSDPRILYEYVYRYDPSISLYDPVDAPRVLKQLLRNMPAVPCSFNNKNELPFVNPCLQVLKRCPIEQIQIS